MFWNPASNPTRGEGESAGSLLFAIGSALERVREGPPGDESLAFAANKMLRRWVDKGAISYKGYRTWRAFNPLIFTSIVDEHNQLIGFFDIFPLKPYAGESLILGKLTERSLIGDHLLSPAQTSSALYVHIATVFVNPRQTAFCPVVAKEVLLLKMRQFIERNYSPVEARTYTAFGHSTMGQAILKRCGFAIAVLAEDNVQRAPLYVLRPAHITNALSRFDHADDFITRKSTIRSLDSRVETIELGLRELIVIGTDGDAAQLPPHVSQKLTERLTAERKKSAAFDGSAFEKLANRLEFCDLRELQDTILSKSLWPKFQTRFGNKETLSAKFDQLAQITQCDTT